MKKYLELLRQCSLFENMTEQDFLSILSCLDAKQVSYMKEQTIFAEGDYSHYFGIVLSGTVQMMQIDYYGNKSIVAKLEPSQVFGETFAYAETKTIPVDIIACEPTEVLLIDARKITRSCPNACSFHNQIIFNLLKIIANKNLIFQQKIEITSKRSTREKLMTYLLLQAKLQNSNQFYIPYDRQELADYLEVDRSGLSAEIGKLRKEGILDCKKNYFSLL